MILLDKIKSLNKKFIIPAVATVVVVAIVLSLLMSSSSISNSIASNSVIKNIGNDAVVGKRTGEDVVLNETGYTVIAQLNGRTLEYDGEWNIFRVTDTSTGQVWTSSATTENLAELNNRERRLVSALLSVNYSEEGGNESSVSNTSDDVNIKYFALENGIEVKFDFYEQGFAVSLQVWLSETGFYAALPAEDVYEYADNCKIMSIDVLPAFGALITGSDGYFIYPDGNGSVFKCDDTFGKQGMISQMVYADQFNAEEKKVSDIRIQLPYFASISNGTKGIAGYVVSGDENSRVALAVGTPAIPFNRIYSSAVYRYVLTAEGENDKVYNFETDFLKEMNYCVHYDLLNSSEADYSGVANAVRNLMKRSDILPSEKAATEDSVYLEVLMNIKSSEHFTTGNFVMTSYKQLYEILNSLKENKVDGVITNMLGWQSNGYAVYPEEQTLSSDLGTKTDFNKLSEFCGKNGIELMLQTDYVLAESSNKALNVREQITYSPLDKAISDQQGKWFLLSPRVAYKCFLSDLKYFEKKDIKALAFNSFSDYIPLDYFKNRVTSANETIRFYSAFLKKCKDEKIFVASQGANSYLLKYSDFLYNVPEKTSSKHMFDGELPMIPMILHGSIGFSGTIPGNMSSDYEETYLKWAETGSIPYFLITSENASNLKGTKADNIYNSRFTDWEKEIVKTANTFKKEFAVINNSEIVKHQKITDEIVCVTYDNGYKVYVNYSYEKFEINDKTVPARDFIVTK